MSDIIVTISPIVPEINITSVSGAVITVSQPVVPNLQIVQQAPPVIEVQSLGARGLQGVPGPAGDALIYTAGENLVSHQPIALVGGLAYKMDYTNPLHQFAFVGFSKTSAVSGGTIEVETTKIELAGWGLLPNQTYMAGASGGLITTNTTPSTFSKIVGFAQSATTMLIVKDYTSINKN